VDSVVHGCADGSEVDRWRGPEVALFAKGIQPLCIYAAVALFITALFRVPLQRGGST